MESFTNRTLYDVMNHVLGNTLTMSDVFHKAIYFLTNLKLSQWHHIEICVTKMTVSHPYQMDMEEREEVEVGEVDFLS